MTTLIYDMLDFWEEQDTIRVNFSKRFYTYINKTDLTAIAPFTIQRHQIDFDCSQKRAERRFLSLLNAQLPQLKTIGTKNSAVYIHQHSGIPLMGNLAFGIIHRGTSIIEVKPQTSCNLDCIYCSVNEGLSSNQTDYLVERAYLVQEFKRVAEFVNIPVEAHIGVQGEPFFYSEFSELAEEFSKMDNVYRITTDTNGTLLNKPLIDRLSKIPKLRLNISLNAVDKDVATALAGANYNTKHVMDMIAYAAERMDILVAPLYVPGYNDKELLKIIKFVQTLPKEHIKQKDYPIIGIQNFLNYKTGRNPVKQEDWDTFMSRLRELEKETGERLILDFKKDFKITETPQLRKPFKKGNVVSATIVAPGRYPNTRLAVSGEGDGARNITIFSCIASLHKKIKVKILRSKHNVFFGKEL
jgi:uncharacterized protein